MKSNLELFKQLATCDVKDKDKKTINLLEGSNYYSNACKLIDILNKISSNKIEFEIIHGFKGSNFEKSNKFNRCTIKLINSNDITNLEKILSKYESCKYKIKENNNIIIQVKV